MASAPSAHGPGLGSCRLITAISAFHARPCLRQDAGAAGPSAYNTTLLWYTVTLFYASQDGPRVSADDIKVGRDRRACTRTSRRCSLSAAGLVHERDG